MLNLRGFVQKFKYHWSFGSNSEYFNLLISSDSMSNFVDEFFYKMFFLE